MFASPFLLSPSSLFSLLDEGLNFASFLPSSAFHPVQAPPTCLDLVLSTDHPETLVTRTYLNVLQLNDEVLVPYFGEVRGEGEVLNKRFLVIS